LNYSRYIFGVPKFKRRDVKWLEYPLAAREGLKVGDTILKAGTTIILKIKPKEVLSVPMALSGYIPGG
jgi:hypothetical protein